MKDTDAHQVLGIVEETAEYNLTFTFSGREVFQFPNVQLTKGDELVINLEKTGEFDEGEFLRRIGYPLNQP